MFFLSSCDSVEPEVYTITTQVNISEAGHLSLANGSSFEESTEIKIEATPNQGWVFVRWGGDIEGTQNPRSLVVNSTMEIEGIFERQQIPLDIEIEGEGTMEEVVVSSGQDYPSETDVELRVQVADLWQFDHWEGDLTGRENPTPVILTCDMNIAAAFTPAMPLDGLMAYYPFNGNANDISRNGNSGSVIGATPTQDRCNDSNGAYLFDGVNDYINIGSALKPAFPITIAAWIRLEFDPGFIGYGIVTNNYDQEVNNGVWMAISSTRRIAVSYGDGGPIGRSSRRTKIGTTTLQSGVWYHVVGIINGRNDMELYVNGVNDGGFLEGGAVDLSYSGGSGNVGRRGSGVGLPPIYFEGAIDDLAFYNRALTTAEVAALYNNVVSSSRR